MKIHKKILTHYLSCPSPVDKEGYLYKKKERNGTYHRRWFVLKGNLLFYQDRPADRHLLGVIVLEGCAVRRSDCHTEFSLVFEGLKTYRFAAADRHRQESWVKSLLTATHCYLSLLVRDLGRQYEEAKHQHSSAESDPSSTLNTLRMTSELVLPPTPAIREGRSHSASTLLQSPLPKVMPRKSPKLFARRNAHVTPLNGPPPQFSEWPFVDFDPLQEFSKLHDYYGQEVKKAREEWLRSRQTREERADDKDLIELG